MRIRPALLTVVAVVVAAQGCVVPGAESVSASQQPQAPAPMGPSVAPQRICLNNGEGIGPCAGRRVSVKNKSLVIRHEAASQLFDIFVRGTRRVTGQQSFEGGELDNGMKFVGWSNEQGDSMLSCYRLETDTVCVFSDDDADATTELFEGETEPTADRVRVDEFEAAGTDDQAQALAMLAVFMAAAVAPLTMGEEGPEPAIPADGLLSMGYGHWSCQVKRPPTAADAPAAQDEDAPTAPDHVFCRLARENGPVPTVESVPPAPTGAEQQ